MSYSRLPPPSYSAFPEEPPEYEYTFEKPKEPVESEKFEESFEIAAPKYNDKPFTALFLATVGLFLLLAFKSINSILSNKSIGVQEIVISKSSSFSAIVPLLFTVFTIPIVSSMAMLYFVWAMPVLFVVLGYFMLPITAFGLSITLVLYGKPGPAVFLALGGLFQLWYLFRIRRNISFTGLVFRIIIETMFQYPSTILVSCISSLLSGIVGLTYLILASIIAFDRLKRDDANCPHDSDGNDVCVSNTTLAINLFTLFTGYFVFEVIENLTHVTISGIYGSWYFFHASAVKPLNPAWGSFKRAITYSFGSICFGSLIVSVTRTIRAAITMMKEKVQDRQFNRDEGEGNGAIMCALICIFSIFEWIADQAEFWIKWFNKFAYSYLALYGKDYLSSARDTYELLRFRGLLVLVTDCLVESTITLCSILIALLSGGIFYFIYEGTQLFQEMSPAALTFCFILQLLLGLFITKVTLNSVNSGFITFLIALSINPEVFEQTYHDYYVKLTNFYPEISHTLKTPFPETV
ncbi:hypothetical protein OGAPHI_007376 [Ogataea philodendri]|uniref:Protein PNS1 n=1 Tax=Ogataea philodendri TaxID=1378263 RepID=A0A9P8T026_9ASCO|nr:uncharacterized protein OGAPHI_007376 [Ogataea philodendri]KAH3660171.1 hypothetical protein OGAPHI_007376 [Ogataea philodendri]